MQRVMNNTLNTMNTFWGCCESYYSNWYSWLCT